MRTARLRDVYQRDWNHTASKRKTDPKGGPPTPRQALSSSTKSRGHQDGSCRNLHLGCWVNVQILESGSLRVESSNRRRGRLCDLAKARELVNTGAKTLSHGSSDLIFKYVTNVAKEMWGLTGACRHAGSDRKVRQANLSPPLSLWHKANHISSICPCSSPFIHSLNVCSCVLNPGLG